MSEYYLNTIIDSEKKKILELQELILVESLNFYKKQYKNPDGTFAIKTGCYIYEIRKR